jgi:hypothetical protein
VSVPPRLGPLFYVVLVAERDDGVCLYLGEKLDPHHKRYERQRLGGAATFHDRDHAVIHLEAFPELRAEVVARHRPIEEGSWEAWHQNPTLRGIFYAPCGGYVRHSSAAADEAGKGTPERPWTATMHGGEHLVDGRGRLRVFKHAQSAAKALVEANRQEL